MSGTVHIVGAGLAGLSAALHLASAGKTVRVYEGSGQAGGRCRSYHDARLDRQIDNGNHLVVSGNTSVAQYLQLADASDAMITLPEAKFPFVDLASGERWQVHMNDGPVPWWPLAKERRPRGVGLGDMLRAGMILFAGPQHTIAAVCGGKGPVHTRFWEPMAMAVINLPPEQASAQLMRATALEAWRDGRLARPMIAPKGLGPALIEPALAKLEEQGVKVEYGRIVKSMERDGGRVQRLRFARDGDVDLAPEDQVILAIPAHRLAELLPEVPVPTETSSILNAHFLIEDPSLLEGKPPILGVVSSVTQWIFLKGDIISLTISAAEYVEGSEGQEQVLLDCLWRETAQALELPSGMTYASGRIVREKRATFLQTPENNQMRPKPWTPFHNLFLAGDFTDTGLPATIESAVRSGERAAALVTK